MYGEKLTSKSGTTGYSGIFWGSVRNEDGSQLQYAQDVFFEIDGAWEIINDKLQRHLQKHIGVVDRKNYHWQCGFGGDEMDGMLDFWLPTPLDCPPDMKFTILNKKYVMSFSYGWDNSCLSSEEENHDYDY